MEDIINDTVEQAQVVADDGDHDLKCMLPRAIGAFSLLSFCRRKNIRDDLTVRYASARLVTRNSGQRWRWYQLRSRGAERYAWDRQCVSEEKDPASVCGG